MTYKVDIPLEETNDWSSRVAWNNQISTQKFNEYLAETVDGVISCEFVYSGLFSRYEIEFESEQYYHWFLLQQ